jgi:hypothetical protein
MKRLFLFLSFISMAALAGLIKTPKVYAQIPVEIDCTIGFSEIEPGIEYKEGSVTSPRAITYHIVRVDLTDPNIDLVVTPECALGTTTTQFMSTFGANIGINGDLHFSTPEWDPLGRAASEADQYSDPSGEPSFFISEDNSVHFFNRGGESLWDALSGSHTIVEDGNIDDLRLTNCAENPAFCTIRPRTSVGVSANGNELIIIVVEGDQFGLPGVTIREVGYMQAQCGANDAINMDGGSSTTLASTAGLIAGSNATVANHLGICIGSCVSTSAYCGISPTPAQPSNQQARPRYGTPLYPFPCSQVAPDDSVFGDVEFHSLRPYQASPCNPVVEDIALFCGNDLVLNDPVTIIKHTSLPDLSVSYTYEGEPIAPVDRVAVDGPFCYGCVNGQCVLVQSSDCLSWGTCAIDIDCLDSDCTNNGDGTETCSFNITETQEIAVDLEDAELPIMGYTEPSVGNQTDDYQVINNYFQNETMDDPTKVNEYVSWYLNGLIGRAEYNPPDPESDEIYKVVDYSGPIKKLSPMEIQDYTREAEVEDALAGNIRHNQVTGCEENGVPVDCPTNDDATRRRLSYWENQYPPVRSDYETPEEYLEALTTWRGDTIWRLFSYIPFSSTEDRLGEVEIDSYTIQPITTGFRILSSAIINQEPAELFFAHMQETYELADITQQIFAHQEADLNARPERSVVPYAPFCDLTAIRSNPGDLLFPGELRATVEYTAQVDCTFLIPYVEPVPDPGVPPGNLCVNLLGAECSDINLSDYECAEYYGQVDCPTGQNCVDGCSPLPTDQECDSLPPIGNLGPFSCYPSDWNCSGVIGSDEPTCPNGYDCADDPCYQPSSTPNLDQVCENLVQIAFSTVTKTPLSTEIWAKLVAGPTSVFRRIFPQIIDEIGRPIRRLWDLPAATDVTYQVLTPGVTVSAGNPGSGRGSTGELYFAHIGGIHEYFLNCLQKTLRPDGFGQGCATGPLPPQQGPGSGNPPSSGVCGVYPPENHQGPIPTRGGACQPGEFGWCSIATLTDIINNQRGLGWNPQQIELAAIICNGESGGWTNALNDGCLCNRTCDFSIGLFQINALPGRCNGQEESWEPDPNAEPNAFDAFPVASCPAPGTWSCDYGTSSYCCIPHSDDEAVACIEYWSDPETNINKMVSLSQNGTVWDAWAYYLACR